MDVLLQGTELDASTLSDSVRVPRRWRGGIVMKERVDVADSGLLWSEMQLEAFPDLQPWSHARTTSSAVQSAT
jgi:hypothetical protein